MPELQLDPEGNILVDDEGNQLIDERYDAYDDDGNILVGGRFDPGRSIEELESFKTDLNARGQKLNDYERALLFQKQQERTFGEDAGAAWTVLTSAMAGVASLGRSAWNELSRVAKIGNQQLGPLGSVMANVPGIGPAATIAGLVATEEGRTALSDLKKNAATGVAEQTASNLAFGQNIAERVTPTSTPWQLAATAFPFATPFLGLAENALGPKAEQFKKWNNRLDREEDLAIATGREANLNDPTGSNLASAAISVAYHSIADQFGDDSEIGAVAREVGDKYAAGNMDPEIDMPGVQFLAGVLADPTSYLIGPITGVGAKASQALLSSKLIRGMPAAAGRTAAKVVEAPQKLVHSLASKVGSSMTPAQAKVISDAMVAKGLSAAAGAGIGISLNQDNWVTGGVIGGLLGPVAAKGLGKIPLPGLLRTAGEGASGLLTQSDALRSGLRAAAMEATDPLTARLLSGLELVSGPTKAVGAVGRDIASGAVGDAIYGYLRDGSPEAIGEEIGEGVLFSPVFGAIQRGVDAPARVAAQRDLAINRWLERVGPEQQGALRTYFKSNPNADPLKLASLDLFARGAAQTTGQDIELRYVDKRGIAVGLANTALETDEDIQNAVDQRGSYRGAQFIRRDPAAGADRNVILVNVDAATGKTPYHELWHGISDLAMPDRDNFMSGLRSIILGSRDEQGWKGDGLYNVDEINKAEAEYTSRLSVADKADWDSKPLDERWNQIFHEMSADYFADFASKRTLTKAQHAQGEYGVAYTGGVLEGMRRFLSRTFSTEFDVTGDPIESDHFTNLKRDPRIAEIFADFVNAKNAILERVGSDPTDEIATQVKATDAILRGNEELAKNLEGVLFKPGQVDNLGRPIPFESKRQREEHERKAGQGVFSIAEKIVDGSAVKILRGATPGGDTILIDKPLTQEQEDAILNDPDPNVPRSVRDKIVKASRAMKERGKPLIVQYFAAIKVGRTRSKDQYSSELSMTTPILSVNAIKMSRAGNFLVNTFEHGWYLNNLNKAPKKKLALWNGDKAAFHNDFMDVLFGHEEGKTAASIVGREKAEAIYDLLDVDQLGGERNRRTSVVRDRRLDRIGSISDANLERMPFNYGLVRQRFAPGLKISEAELADLNRVAAGEMPTTPAPEPLSKKFEGTEASGGRAITDEDRIRFVSDNLSSLANTQDYDSDGSALNQILKDAFNDEMIPDQMGHTLLDRVSETLNATYRALRYPIQSRISPAQFGKIVNAINQSHGILIEPEDINWFEGEESPAIYLAELRDAFTRSPLANFSGGLRQRIESQYAAGMARLQDQRIDRAQDLAFQGVYDSKIEGSGQKVEPMDPRLDTLLGPLSDVVNGFNSFSDGAYAELALTNGYTMGIGVRGPIIDAESLLPTNDVPQAEARETVDTEAEGASIGVRYLSSMILNGPALGFTSIETAGGGDGTKWVALAGEKPDMNGYKTWPKLGYDATVNLVSFKRKAQLKFPITTDLSAEKAQAFRDIDEMLSLGAQPDGMVSVRKINETKRGQALWSAYGMSLNLAFDLAPGSASIKHFNQYVKRLTDIASARNSKLKSKTPPAGNPDGDVTERTMGRASGATGETEAVAIRREPAEAGGGAF